MARPEWTAARVRFLEGGRSQQTPAALWLDNAWQPLSLIQGSLRAESDSSRPYQRHWVVSLPEGELWELLQKGPQWLMRPYRTA